MAEFICGILNHFFHLLVFFLHVLSSLSTHQMLNARITNSFFFLFSSSISSFSRSLSLSVSVVGSRTHIHRKINILRWQMHSIWDYLCSLLIILRLNYRAFFHFINVWLCACVYVCAACQSKRAVAIRTLASLHLFYFYIFHIKLSYVFTAHIYIFLLCFNWNITYCIFRQLIVFVRMRIAYRY